MVDIQRPGSDGTVTNTGALTDNSLVRGNGAVDIDVSNIVVSADGNDLIVPGDLTVDTTTLFVDATASEVGIGTITPGTKLHTLSTAADTTSIVTTESTGTNFGITTKFVGDRDPNGNITGAGGDEYYRDDGAISGTYESREATTGTNWLRRSLVSAETQEIHSAADLTELATASVITVAGTLIIDLKADITTDVRFVLTSAVSQLLIRNDGTANLITYTGTSAYLTAADGGAVGIDNILFIADTPATQFLDFKGGRTGIFIDLVSVTDSAIIDFDLGSMGPVSRSEAGPVFLIDTTSIVDWRDSLILDSMSLVSVGVVTMDRSTTTGISKPLFDLRNTAQKSGGLAFNGVIGNLFTGESLLKIDAGIISSSKMTIINILLDSSGGIGLFDTSGTAPTAFTAVADNSIGATAITSVTDSSGVATFNHAGTSPLLGSTVTISGFTTNTAYNKTAPVTATTATTFQVDFIAFGTDETGSYLVNAGTVTSTTHGLSTGTGVVLVTTDATDYDDGYIIYNVQTNTFDIAAVFTVTKAGTWSTEALNQKDRRVLSSGNPTEQDSVYIACAHVNDNSTANAAIVNNTFTDMVFGTGGSALIESSTIERWRLIDELNGTFEYTGLEPFDGLITFDFTVESSGGTVDFRFKWQKSTDGGSSFVNLADDVESLVAVGSNAQSVSKTFPLAMAEAEQIKPQITRNSGSSGITTVYATVYATN